MALIYGSGVYGSGVYGGGYTKESEFNKFFGGLVVLIDLELPDVDDPVLISAGQARFNNYNYEGTLISLGPVRRSMQKNLGIFESMSIDFTVSDVSQTYSGLTRPIKGSLATVRLGTKYMVRSEYQVICKGIVDEFSLNDFTMRFVIRDYLFDLPEYPLTGTVNEDDFPNSYQGHRGMPLPVCYGTHSYTTSDVEDYRDRGAWPTLYIDNTSGAKKFLIAWHHVKKIDEVYATKPSGGSTQLTVTTDYDAYANGYIDGHEAAWIEMDDAQFSSKLLESGSLGHLTVNVQGKMDTGGNLITNPIEAMLDFFGAYLNNPDFDSDSFSDAEDICDDRDYVVRGGVTERKTTAEILQDFAKSFNARFYVTQGGKIGCNIFAPPALGETSKLFHEGRDIIQNSFSIDHNANIEGAEDTQIINKIEYLSDYHYAKGAFFKSNIVSDADSIADYGEKEFQISAPWSDQDASSDVAGRILIQFKQPVAHANFQIGLAGLLSELSEQVFVTHANGAEGEAWSDRRLQILNHSVNPMRGTVDLRCIDVSPITENGFFLDDEDRITRTSTGTAGVTNTSGTITITSGPASLITEGVQLGDIIRLNDGDNISHHEIESVTATTVTVANTVWTNESGIGYDIVASWITATEAQQEYGYLADETTEEFGENSGNLSLWPTDIATDALYFGGSSGAITSRMLGQIYTPQGNPSFLQSGPTDDLKSVELDGTTDSFLNTSPDSVLLPGTKDFVICLHVLHDTGAGTGTRFMLDFDENGAGARPGIFVWLTSTQLQIGVVDDSLNAHATAWTHGGQILNEGRWYCLEIKADRTTNKLELDVNGISKTTAKAYGVNLSALGTITPSGGLCFGARESDQGLAWYGKMCQALIAIDQTTFDFGNDETKRLL